MAKLGEIKEVHGELLNELSPRPGRWQEIQSEFEKKSARPSGSRKPSWPMALVASALIMAVALLIRPFLQDDSADLSPAKLTVLQDPSRVLEAELMSVSGYTGTASESLFQ